MKTTIERANIGWQSVDRETRLAFPATIQYQKKVYSCSLPGCEKLQHIGKAQSRVLRHCVVSIVAFEQQSTRAELSVAGKIEYSISAVGNPLYDS